MAVLGTSTLKPSTSTPASARNTRSRQRQRVSMELPERFQNSDDEEEVDAGRVDDAFAAQSVYGMLAQAQKSRPDLTAKLSTRRGHQSESESEDEEEGKRGSREGVRATGAAGVGELRAEERKGKETSGVSKGHKKRMSESKLLRSFLKPIRERSDSHGQEAMSQSQILPPRESEAEEEQRMSASTADIRSDAPVMDRKLKAKARADLEASTTSQGARKSREGTPTEGHRKSRTANSLPQALADIFQLDEPEEVIAEYPCWYLQSVLLQGYMYITQQHLCFYAYLQKKGNVLVKSGHLSKQGKRNPRYRRHFFQLKGDVLSYYASAADPYFPNGSIDLRYGISADLVTDKDKQPNKETADFTLVTDSRTYYMRADSPASAKEWVRHLQKVIFRSHNDGDSVKICVPLDNVVDVESNPVIDFADTMRLRVLDGDTTFAVDEYFFTFFTRGSDAINVLQLTTQENGAKKAAEELETEELPAQKKRMSPFRRSVSVERSPRLSQSGAPPLPETVRSTLSPLATAPQGSPRLSMERGRSSGEQSRTSFDRSRASFDRGRRSASGTSTASSQWRRMSKSPLLPAAQESSDSFATTSEHPGSPGTVDGKDDPMSASQMLTGDGYFSTPTMRMPQPRRTVSGSTVERLRQESREQSPRSITSGRIQIEPPTPLSRAATNQLSTSPTEMQGPVAREPQPAEIAAGGRSMRAMATPLQHAFTLAGVVRNHGKRMSSYLSSSPKSYYDKFSGAIAGGQRHYSENDALAAEDRIPDPEDDLDTAEHERRFQQHFALPETERLRAVFYCWLHRVLPLYGKIYVSDRRFCFRSLLYGTRTKLVVPFRDIDNCAKEKGFRWGYPGMVLIIRGHEELFFDFGSQGLRDDCVITVLRSLDVTKAALESVILTQNEKEEAQAAAAENELLRDALLEKNALQDRELLMDDEKLSAAPPVLFDDPSASVIDFRPKKSMRITCLTIGSRGDVQPYIALSKGLIAQGHQVKIVTHRKFEEWIGLHGVEFAPVEGDPEELMRMCVENGMFTPSFIVEANSKFRVWLDELLATAWEGCQGAELLIESPSAMAGIHIAEALGIPYFRAFTMPWTRTRAYPHAFAVPASKKGGQYNIFTYTLFDNLFWSLTSNQINRWRRKTLGLNATDYNKLQINKVPFLYNFSPNVVVPPLDYSDWIRVTGYWFLDEATAWKPSQDLVDFIDKARNDNVKLVYVGFGSVPVSDTKFLTQQIVEAVLKADVRCILAKGWSDAFDPDKNNPDQQYKFPDAIYSIGSAPHDWLFKRIDAAVHHGGAGTTGASLRAGVPTIIKPFFGDQYFFATRVEDLGVGIHLKKINVNALGKALWRATHDERMRTKARILGEQIREEDGVGTAINAIYRDLDYARTLIKKKPGQAVGTPVAAVGGSTAGQGGEEEEYSEESWTFVEDVGDVDVTGSRLGSELFAAKSGGVGGHRQSSLGSMVLRGR